MTKRIKGISWLNGAANISAHTKILTDERTRRQVNNLRHATNSELLCEAFLHAFTGQPLPNDDDLRKERSDEIPEEAKVIMRELGIDPETWEY